jgi:LysM repeat protein
MNANNPLVPQGSLLEQKQQRRTRVLFTVMGIIALHVIPITALLLMQGCKRDARPNLAATDATNNFLPPLPTNEFYTTYPPTDTTTTTQPTQPSTPAPGLATAPTLTPGIGPALLPSDTLQPLPTPGTTTEHVVTRGDSFYKLGQKYGVSMKAIADSNPGVDSSKLKIGQKLLIPPPAPAKPGKPTVMKLGEAESAPAGDAGHAVHVVRGGDSLSAIARRYGTSIGAIRAANNLRTTRILVGQKLKVPTKNHGQPKEATPVPSPAANRGEEDDPLRNAISVPEPDSTPKKPVAGAA